MQLVKTTQFNGVTFNCYKDTNEIDSSDFWATREEIGLILGYKNPRKAIKDIHSRHHKRLDKFSGVINLSTPSRGAQNAPSCGGMQATTVYNFKGLLEICRYSNKPKANEVIDFLWDVADEIRRTGHYGDTPQAISDRTRENELETVQLLQRMVEMPVYGLSENDKHKITSKVAQMLAGIDITFEDKVMYRESRYVERDPELIDFRSESEIDEEPYDVINAYHE